MSWHRRFAPYVPVGQRKAEGKLEAQRRLKKGESLQPIEINGRAIATTFWGMGWCSHLEKYCDYSNRLPRGRTYARNGSIADLRIFKGKITSMVCGSSLYDITIKIDALPSGRWADIYRSCSSSIHSIMDLMRGRLGDDVIRRITDPQSGMFPASDELHLKCSCPDGAYLCKHLAATLYGVGHRLDTLPDLLFQLRGVDQNDLISQAISPEGASSAMDLDQESGLDGADLSDIFGIDLADSPSTPTPVTKQTTKRKAAQKSAARRKSSKKKAVKKKASNKNAVRKKTTAANKLAKPAVTQKATIKKTTKKKAAKKKAVKKPRTQPSKNSSPTKRAASKKTAVKKAAVKKATANKAVKKSTPKKPTAQPTTKRKASQKRPTTKAKSPKPKKAANRKSS
ncbi:SWIM zinc finger family protein [Neorhodopirellula lusitana]|uniref:SWIM zinc finger family protein n=1 Tax=Neorhodopirellula lusitana TaxID=445327 RepID=UPI003850D1F4